MNIYLMKNLRQRESDRLIASRLLFTAYTEPFVIAQQRDEYFELNQHERKFIRNMVLADDAMGLRVDVAHGQREYVDRFEKMGLIARMNICLPIRNQGSRKRIQIRWEYKLDAMVMTYCRNIGDERTGFFHTFIQNYLDYPDMVPILHTRHADKLDRDLKVEKAKEHRRIAASFDLVMRAIDDHRRAIRI